MARTIADAFKRVEGRGLDMAIGLVRVRPEPPPVDVEVEMAFSGFDMQKISGVARRLAAISRQPLPNAEDAVQDGYLHLLEQRPEVFREEPGAWTSLLLATARNYLRRISDTRRLASLDEVLREDRDKPPQDVQNVQPCVALTHDVDRQGRFLPRPRVGFVWTRDEIAEAIVSFRNYYGHPPNSADFRAINGLPSPTTVCRHFGSIGQAILAAGMTPTGGGTRRRPYNEEKTVRECLTFRKKEGRWPDGVDVKHNPASLPPASALRRFFGGTRSCDVQQGVEGFLERTT